MPTATQYIEIAGPTDSAEIELEITYSFSRGYPAHYGSMSYAGHPAEPHGVEDIEFTAYEIEYPTDPKGKPTRKEIAVDGFLRDFILRAIDTDELVADALEDEGA